MSDVAERAKAALEGVTPGPWEVRDGFVYPLAIRCQLGGLRPRDAEFITAARTLVPELVAEVERLREEKLGLEISESNLVVQLRAENEQLRATVERVRWHTAYIRDYILAALEADR
ncbi:hypothetical protein SEA_DUPLICITY_53 [Mycobacterium phage Duplicity]|uniref:Uncharacterized protein n=1 Tax=Mycobacterium phage Duplicity TaxID=2912655 RepID=A0AA49BRR0_9CAUD|nr:hypothetical protein SEA_DUPLICITY_53 [Mycobacterium phage Duplicity]